MAKKSEELIEKPLASRGRPRKDASTSTQKKASKSKTKKKTTKKASSSKKSVSKKTKNSTTSKKIESVELVQDVQLEPTIEKPITSTQNLEEIALEETVVEIESTEPEIFVQTQENIEPEEVEINTDAEDKEKNEEVLEIQEQIVEEVVPVISDEQNLEVQAKQKKRTIRNISIKHSSIATTKQNIEIEKESEVQEVLDEVPEKIEIIEENTTSENNKLKNNEIVQEEKVIELPKREKRTLKLNLGSHKKQDSIATPSYKKDESINQNSSFFNEPSIFAKFNIDIISTENEETIEEINESVEEASTSEEVNSDITENETNSETEEIIEETDNNELFESLISEELFDEQLEELVSNELENELTEVITSEEQLNETAEKSDEELEYSIETLKEETEEIDESSILNSVRSILGGKLGSLEDLPENNSKDTTNQKNEIIIENNIDFETEIENEETTNEIFENSRQEVVELKEVAENIIPEEPVIEKSSDNTPIGKFFDSSIPSMTSTVNNTFSKIKKSIFSNISPIFKKFTFEEATLRTHEEELENNYIEPENNLSDIQKALENFTPNVQATNNIIEMDIQAEPVLTIPVVETDTLVQTEPLENTFDIPELNIITPASESSYEEVEDVDTELSESVLENTENTTEEINENLEFPEEEYNDDEFSIEAYFGLDDFSLEEDSIKNTEENETPEEIETITSTPEDFADKFLEENNRETNWDESEELQLNDDETLVEAENVQLENNEISEVINETPDSEANKLEQTLKEKELEISNLSKLLESFTETISTLTNRIADLENKQLVEKETIKENDENVSENSINEILEENTEISEELVEESEEINLDDIDIEDLDLNDLDLNELDFSEDLENEEPSLLSQEEISDEEHKSVESILSEVFLSKDFELDSNLKDELLSEVLSYEGNSSDNETNLDETLLEEALLEELSDEDLTNIENETSQTQDSLSDFSKIIDSLTKAITELEQAPDIKQEVEKKNVVTPLAPLPAELISNSVSEEKAINILINKDDIFSISILNETYEIVADFDGISVLSENLHISTPKNNFFVRVGNKYIEIHNKKDNFILNTNFEDIEFANAINNIAFAKKNNKIELNIKEAFKLSSVNNKIELSMLNKAIADLSSTQTPENKEESSICDNKTLLISEETQKVYLPYTIEDVMKKLKSSEEYQTVQEVVDKEYTLPLSTFKMPIISRFKEAYRFMRTKENSSVYAAVDLALELMFNSNLNPAVIRAAKDLKELNIYLDCLYENEVEKFDCFKIVYKVLPKIK